MGKKDFGHFMMKGSGMKRISNVCLMLLLMLFVSTRTVMARTIVDMLERTVTVPDTIRTVYGTSPPATNLIYAMDPGLLAGLNTPMRDGEIKYMDKRLQALPVGGGWFGQGRTPNMETLLTIRPDIILVSMHKLSHNRDMVEKTLEPLGVPLVFVTMDTLSEYPAVFRFMGELLNRKERAETLAAYAEDTLSRMMTLRESIPDNKRISVYYAEQADGLTSECADSIHAELIPLCGATNVVQCASETVVGMNTLGMEQVMIYRPDVIVTHNAGFYNRVFSDKRWNNVPAVQNKRVYLIPTLPMNWFDRSPSFMRLIGARWLACALYPDLYAFDRDRETRLFYALFLNVTLSDRDLAEIVVP